MKRVEKSQPRTRGAIHPLCRRGGRDVERVDDGGKTGHSTGWGREGLSDGGYSGEGRTRGIAEGDAGRIRGRDGCQRVRKINADEPDRMLGPTDIRALFAGR